ncbi:amino acid ABC transporter permease [Campylobacter corcagiensis]|uniref:Amino acid ABC transporter permease n=1 Tax=Campylobacter corcagiensis TaxID=1448857 RepID=A0A7M1LHN8_9BACT|nr:amino acid ABC transporter permease [Campylobacter corcagiensis]QKF65342.1 pathogenesis-associated glutamine ABC transporter, permease protein [Campylobacter corcagiensis]QOQ88078.1 amino acid ABC transporter permease [Campylobacter corcagiensis]
MDFEFIKEFTPMFITAGILTVKLAFFGIVLSIIIGLASMSSRVLNLKFINKIFDIYIEISRNTPLLIQLFFLYYGLPKVGIKLDSFSCGVIGLAFLGGSYMAESFRLGYEAVKKAQIEAGLSLGLSKFQLIFHVILPQAFFIALPSISANIIFLTKETSIVSVIALADLVYATKDIMGLYYMTDEALFMLVVSYLIIILPISLGLTLLEKRLSYV